MSAYLAATPLIDWRDARIARKARELAQASANELSLARRSFEFVRDAVRALDAHARGPLPVSASDVLAHGMGTSFAKTHLLAALLRANRIEAGMCYQRLVLDDEPGVFHLHGLNALRLSGLRWFRVDPACAAAGKRAGGFDPPREQLSRIARHPGEADLPEVWAEPPGVVIDALVRCGPGQALRDCLPDIELVFSQPAPRLE